MNRIDITFASLASANRKALVAFLTAGDPDFDASLAILRTACASGVDVLELGVPFSDPTCDGPVIQMASERALKAGMSLSRTIRLAAELRKTVETPLVLFSYYNPLFKYGLERLSREVAAAGVDGLLVVDLPPEEAGPLTAALRGTGIHLIRLAAPTGRAASACWPKAPAASSTSSAAPASPARAGSTTARSQNTPPRSRRSARTRSASDSASAAAPMRGPSRHAPTA